MLCLKIHFSDVFPYNADSTKLYPSDKHYERSYPEKPCFNAAGGQYSEAGTIEARNGATVNLAAACDDPTNVTVIVSNAVLAVSGTANVSVSIQDGWPDA